MIKVSALQVGGKKMFKELLSAIPKQSWDKFYSSYKYTFVEKFNEKNAKYK